MPSDEHEPEKDSGQPLLVVGAGLSRTGTLSLQRALQKLGFKVLHGKEFLDEGLDGALLRAVETNDERAWDDFFVAVADLGYNATVDQPTSLVFQEQLKRYPDAKVVLTLRDDAAAWEDSFRRLYATLLRWFRMRPLRWFRANAANDWLLENRYGLKVEGKPCTPMDMEWWIPFSGECISELATSSETLQRFYREHNELVRTRVPAGQLLEFRATDGWEPLERFLDAKREVPNEPFPKINDQQGLESFADVHIRTVLTFSAACLLVSYAALQLLCRRLVRKR